LKFKSKVNESSLWPTMVNCVHFFKSLLKVVSKNFNTKVIPSRIVVENFLARIKHAFADIGIQYMVSKVRFFKTDFKDFN